jgi:hypothetical protein
MATSARRGAEGLTFFCDRNRPGVAANPRICDAQSTGAHVSSRISATAVAAIRPDRGNLDELESRLEILVYHRREIFASWTMQQEAMISRLEIMNNLSST